MCKYPRNRTFTETFVREFIDNSGSPHREILTVWQNGNVVTRTFELSKTCWNCDCTVTFSVPGTSTLINETTGVGSSPGKTGTCVGNGGCTCTYQHYGGTGTVTLIDNGRILQTSEGEYICQ